MKGLRIQLLSGFRVTAEDGRGADVNWRGRPATLIKWLALASRRSLHREQIQETLWPDADPEAAANNLRQTVYLARRTLDAVAPGGGGLLLSEGPQLRLDGPDAVWIDVEAFEAASETADRTGDPAAYQAAAELYMGDLLPQDLYHDWVAPRREALRQRFTLLLSELARIEESRGNLTAAISVLRRLIAHDPALENAYASLMRLLAQTGERQAALRQFSQLRATLRRHLDAEPDASTQDLYQAILSRVIPAAGDAKEGGAANTVEPVKGIFSRSEERSRQSVLHRHNLPAPLTSFVGREAERAAVTHLLHRAANDGTPDVRLVTLTGPGGSGKTRLALAVAQDLVEAGAFPDGIWLADLAALHDPALVPSAIAGAVDVREEPGRALLESLTVTLRDRSLLLVLDNCEHLLSACASLVTTLLRGVPGLRVLTTSQARLRVPGELAWPVAPLSLPAPSSPALLPTTERLVASEAVQLFVMRAGLAQPGFTLSPEKAPAVVEVCRRLGGMPLALELAACRLSVLSVHELAARLDNALCILGGGNRTAPERQQTLRATLDWSHQLLDEREQVLFHRLAVFAGGWTLEATESVCEDDDVFDGLASLLDKSLLRREIIGGETSNDAETRFVMLETIRAYGLERLEAAGEAPTLRDRHAGYYLDLVSRLGPQLRGPTESASLVRLEREHDNVRQALSWFLERGQTGQVVDLIWHLWAFWWIRGHLSEGQRWIERAVAHFPAGDAPGRLQAALGAMAYYRGEYAHGATLADRAVAALRQTSDPEGLARALVLRGGIALNQGDHQRAAAFLEESAQLYGTLGDRWGAASALSISGEVAMSRGEYDEAKARFTKTVVVFRALGAVRDAAYFGAMLGLLSLLEGDDVQAASHLREALRPNTGSLDRFSAVYCLEGLAAVAAAQGKANRAACLFGATAAVRRTTSAAPLVPIARDLYDRLQADASRELGQETWAAAWNVGSALSLRDAVAEALSGE